MIFSAKSVTHARPPRQMRCRKRRVCACCCRCRWPGLTTMRRRPNWRWRPAISCACRWARATWRASCGTARRAMFRGEAEACRRALARAAAERGAAPLHRLGGELHAGAAGRGAAHGDERARRARPGAGPHRLCARRSGPRGARRRRLGHAGAPARARSLAAGPPLPAMELARQAACGAGVVRALAAAGLIEPVALPRRLPPKAPDWRRPAPIFRRSNKRPPTHLPPRSPKTASPSRCSTASPARARPRSISPPSPPRWSAGRQVLVLLPEIALSAQWLARFAERFGAAPAEWHSDLRRRSARPPGALSPRATRGSWSARARRCSCRSPISASSSSTRSRTPPSSRRTASSITRATWRWCAPRSRRSRSCWCRRRRRSRPSSMCSRAAIATSICRRGTARARLPEIRVIDMRRAGQLRQRFLAPQLVEALAATLAAREQAMLFLNRRGYAPLTLCRVCGHRLNCPNCTAWLVEHRFIGTLQCHHCGHSERVPPLCPECGAASSFAPCGPGVERLAEEVTARFPGGAPRDHGERHADRPARRRRAHGSGRGPRDRRADRHAGGGEGPSLPAADAGRRGRCRSRPRGRRFARGRAHVPAACTRSRAAPAAPSGRASSISRPTCRRIR